MFITDFFTFVGVIVEFVANLPGVLINILAGLF